ncbi:MarR family winged helix-turn-helix transcriptional regulator [Actinotalea sp. Marseille-Q4924]|uniref:MarR family winged helix-turn-helix transcriptional regulator n=1 Tax=Actinotalea sp. Marseille-Q4924 TaxID=2866571 RepID=UPI001CE3BE29|nr:MarR family transcriptional regulator [Actinotalea sp. Marseille-Q4924]MDT0166032.1 MarR family transcriptional regulator [Actinotalea sp. AC32]
MERDAVMAAIAEDEAALIRLFSRAQFTALLQTTLTMQQLKVLLLLHADGSLMSHELADALKISPASVTGLVDRLEHRGLVERVADPTDRRARQVHPTAQGSQLVDTLMAEGAGHRVALLSLLDDDSVRTIATAFAALRRAAEQVYGDEVSGAPERPSGPVTPPEEADRTVRAVRAAVRAGSR